MQRQRRAPVIEKRNGTTNAIGGTGQSDWYGQSRSEHSFDNTPPISYNVVAGGGFALTTDTLYTSLRADIAAVEQRLTSSMDRLEKRIDHRIDDMVTKRRWAWGIAIPSLISLTGVIVALVK